ncbi:alpha/beta fold hydrolase [Jatrophihabitans sp. DSM 45814]
MQVIVDDHEVHYVEHGRGRPVFALHGAGVDHREIEAWLEPIFAHRDGYRRVYPDLPGMGLTPAGEGLTSNDDVVSLLLGLVDRVAFEEPFLVVGHSYGGYLARAIVANRRDQAVGLAIVCPVGESSGEVPAHEVVYTEPAAYDVLPAETVDGFNDYFVVRTQATAQRYLDAVVPAVALADETGLARIFGNWAFRSRPEDDALYQHPALILTGRQDSAAGYVSSAELLPDYPHATYAVIDGAGHALPHEKAQLVASFFDDWLTRSVDVSG